MSANRIRCDYPNVLAHILFEQQAALSPDATAIAFGERRISYGELNSYANQLVIRLRELGVELGVPVGVFLQSNWELIGAVLAVLKSGGVLVPLDTTYPRARIEYIVRDSRLQTIITSRTLAAALPSHLADIICVELSADSVSPQSSISTKERLAFDDAACVIYTSGSTGYPKGVVRTHRGIQSRLAWAPGHSDDVFCHNMSLTVGFSQERLLVPLMCGLPLVVVPEEDYVDAGRFSDTVERHGITQITTVPGFLRQLLDLGPRVSSQLRSVRSVAAGSAALPATLIARFQCLLPDATLINAYGSTETGSAIRGGMSASHVSEGVTIGRPVPNAEVYVLGEEMSPLSIGTLGELYIGGPSLAAGYLNRPDLTEQRFLSITLDPSEPMRLFYRTGDRGRYLPNGEIELLGRLDRQVKIRGFRVELGEIEYQLEQIESIQKAIVKPLKLAGQESKLIGYLEPKSGSRPSVTTLRRQLRLFLPEHMVPANFVLLERLPRTLNGKLDPNALPVPSAERPDLDSPYEPPRCPMEESIVALWERVLEVKGLGIHDDFLELGGDSLSAAQVLPSMEALGVQATLQRLFEHGTIAALVSKETFAGTPEC